MQDGAMPRWGPIMLAACLSAALVQGCSQAEPAPQDFTRINQRPTPAEEAAAALEAAQTICKEKTKRKGLASVVGIFSRLRKGAADEDYIACMKQRGFEVRS
jgi:hypothetical protein